MNQNYGYINFVETENFFDKIWTEFLRILQREINNSSQAEVARRLGINRGQVSKWLSGLQIGGNLKTFITHAERLGLDWKALLCNEHDVITLEATPFDKALIETIRASMELFGQSCDDILPLTRTKPLTTEELFKISTATGIEAGVYLKRAAEISNNTEIIGQRRRSA